MYAACKEVYAPSGTLSFVSSSAAALFFFFFLVSFFFFFFPLEAEDEEATATSRLRFEDVEFEGVDVEFEGVDGELASSRGTFLGGDEVPDAGGDLRFFGFCKQTKVHSSLRRNDHQDRYTE